MDFGEDKIYLVCLTGRDNDLWNIITGRKSAYNYIKENIEDYSIDVYQSFILAETCTINGKKTIYDFMKYCESIFTDSDFNIDDYINDVEKKYDIDQDVVTNDRLDIADIMDGNIKTTPLN